MNTSKKDIADRVAAALNLQVGQTRETVNEAVKQIADALAKGEKLHLAGLGILSVKESKERTGRNPATGATITIAASKNVRFKTAADLKSRL